MLPTVVAQELQQAVQGFLQSSFPFSTQAFQQGAGQAATPTALIDGLINEPGTLFKGPYLDIKLPFRQADASELPFRHLQLPFNPYAHQMTAFNRLVGEAPQSTIVATGTGSGKTECFMLPVLEDCLARSERGIKTIVIYPMNALASDQARRFAKEVAQHTPGTRVGLFVGGEVEADATTAMGPNNVITSHEALRENPPDILLTNYKMLDFLLIRPSEARLWRHNQPGTLRYLVVDELHTFDGAQGTDLACLIRRLRARLDAGPELACVGTSATMGSGTGDKLVRFASTVFKAEFDKAGIIGESRLSPEEYLDRASDQDGSPEVHWPEADPATLDPANYSRQTDYLYHQARLWFPRDEGFAGLVSTNSRARAESLVHLGERLYHHRAFHQLVSDARELISLEQLAEDWQGRLDPSSLEYARLVLTSLTSLVAAARQWDRPESDNADDWTAPFLYLRQQLWLRELRRLLCSVPGAEGGPPRLAFKDDLNDPESPLHLPLLHCRECHLGAWGGVIPKGDDHLAADSQAFYQHWFNYSASAALLVPVADDEVAPNSTQHFCPACRRLQATRPDGRCTECESENLWRVWVPDLKHETTQGGQRRVQVRHNCPECGAHESLTVLGYRAATLTSVMCGRLYATPYNDDHKLIAFSDSVQDAAHRAGFIGANTWRNVVRQALYRWLAEQPASLSLREMQNLLPAYWRERLGNDARFCGLFIAPDMQWLRDYRYLAEHDRLPQGSDLPDLIGQRLGWECLVEFGMRARIGRSLERTGQAEVAFDESRLASDLAPLITEWREELEPLRELDDNTALAFVRGWLHHLRHIGALDHPALQSYLAERGNHYLLNKQHWLPGYGKKRTPPAAISLEHLANNFEALVQSRRDTWSVRWLKRTLGEAAPFVAAEARQIFRLMLNALTRAGWLVEKQTRGESIWLLDPACLKVRPLANERADQVYGKTDPHRLVPAEHTGLLTREERERVETTFITGEEPWHVNLLSATPTLEMGINIGDLSTVILCSVPPAQANYLQRIGRAGRRDGNSLAVTVANGEPHDLYFYNEPTEMMAGAIQTPGVFLGALAVLERQLMAFCMDRWAASGIDEAAIPQRMKAVLDAIERDGDTGFPYNLLAFIRENRADLLEGFLALFSELEDAGRDWLAEFIAEDTERGLRKRLLDRLEERLKQRQNQQATARQLKRDLAHWKAQPEDEATAERIRGIEQERTAILGFTASLNGQAVLNYLTDEGLLPNYAFPEEGVTLNSVILRRRSRQQRSDGKGAYEKDAYTFQRPAQAALGELAPENRFYAVSHVLDIDQVDMKLSTIEHWRFCDQCHYSQNIDTEGDTYSACPRCGSGQWSDATQRHEVLRLRQVYSTVEDRTSRIGDDSERREPIFYNRQMLVDIPAEGHQGGFRLASDALPFGFELLSRVRLREVNFGPAMAEGNSFTVAGQERPRQGFKVCRECGKVQRARPRPNEPGHAYNCPLREQEDTEDQHYIDGLFLYRELDSEAIRILLPLSEVAYSETGLHSFIAALQLGLKKYYEGDVHHLQVTTMVEPETADSAERVHLVVYDRIPGGTGYLKDLMRDPANLLKVLEEAHEHLLRCRCVGTEKDGCYSCLLAYRTSRHNQSTSRDRAIELLSEILALKDQLTPVAALSEINTNSLVESKLEQRFLDALKALPGARMESILANGRNASRLTLPGPDDQPRSWLVEHQVKLGPAQGVALNTEVDVLISPARAADAGHLRPIAVYMDGLQYHHGIVGEDACKRSALLHSGRYRVFTLGWDDLPASGALAKPQTQDLMAQTGQDQNSMASFWDQLAGPQGWRTAVQQGGQNGRGGFQWLEVLLRAPEDTERQLFERAAWRAFSALAPTSARDAHLRQKLVYELAENAPETVIDRLSLDDPAVVPGGFMDALGNSQGAVELSVGLAQDHLGSNDLAVLAAHIQVHLCFDDRDSGLDEGFKVGWRNFWHCANQLQFLPGFSLATRQAVADGRMDALWAAISAMPTAPGTTDAGGDDAWQAVFDECLLTPERLVAIRDLGLTAPQVGLDLTDATGEVVIDGGTVELCWPDARVAVLAEPATKALAGWRLIADSPTLVDELELLQKDGAL